MNGFPISAIAVFIAITSAIAGCIDSSSGGHPIPRREAYPRPQLYDTVYRTISGIPLHIEINEATDITVEHRDKGILWVSQKYPLYGISVYYTILQSDTKGIDKAIKRSLRRMTDNLGTLPAERHEAQGIYGFNHYILTSIDPGPFPVQFVSTDHKHWLVYGTATFTNGQIPAANDSITPVISALRKDMVHTLNTLRHGDN